MAPGAAAAAAQAPALPGGPAGARAAPRDPGTPLTAPPAGAETTLWEGRPSLKALATRIAATVLFVVLLPLAVYLVLPWVMDLALGAPEGGKASGQASVKERRHDVALAATAIMAAVIVLRLARLGWQIASLKAQRYRVSNQRIVIESGVLSRRIEEIDMRTVEDLAFHQSFLERLLGIGTIVVIAADRTATRHPLVGITSPRETRELIRGSAYQATHRQLFTRQT